MPEIETENPFRVAVRHFQAGQFAHAERTLRQLLSQQPNHPEALHLLAMIAIRFNRAANAIPLLRRALVVNERFAAAHNTLGNAWAITGNPQNAIVEYRRAIELGGTNHEATYNLGNALREVGKLDEAIDAYRKSIELKSDWPVSHVNLGNALMAAAKHDHAMQAYEQAIKLDPKWPVPYNNIGNILVEQGRYDEAIALFRKTVEMDARHSKAWYNLGNVWTKTDHPRKAVEAYRKAIAIDPNYRQAISNLSNLLLDLGQIDEAIVLAKRAIELEPGKVEYVNNLGHAFRVKGRLDEAIEMLRRAISMQETCAQAWCNLGTAYQAKLQMRDAIAAYGRAIAIDPQYPEAHMNKGMAHLAIGEYDPGWEEAEWRWKTRHFKKSERGFNQPQWTGEDLTGKTILLHAEQGYGDTFQFIRYLPLVREKAARVIVECQPLTKRMVSLVTDGCVLVEKGEPLPEFDVHCPLLSLPRALKTTEQSMPGKEPYLLAEPELVERWKARLANDPRPRKVGIVWAGNKKHKDDHNRSIRLALMSDLFKNEQISFYSLQRGDDSVMSQMKDLGPDSRLIDVTADLDNFADTAALIMNLDLVITVDTAVAHLAGGLGKPCWVLVPYCADWRWGLDREDCPWYPTARVFRQTKREDWESVLIKVQEALSQL